MALCLSAGAVTAQLIVTSFTLSWTHSIEKTIWEEDWKIENHRLVLSESRIQGHGAGMEPSPDARFDGHWWHSHPLLPPLPSLSLARSEVVADWIICWPDGCEPISSLLHEVTRVGPITLYPCS